MRVLVTSIVDLRRTSHNRLHEFVRHLSRSHSVTVLSLNDWWKAKKAEVKHYEQGLVDILDKVDLRYFTQKRYSPILQEVFSPLKLRAIMAEMDESSFDVHFNYDSLVSGYYVARRMRQHGKATVFDIADDLPEMVATSPQIPRALRPLGRSVARRFFLGNIGIASRVVPTDPHFLELYPQLSGKATVIPNGVDTIAFSPIASTQLRRQLGIKGFVLGYVGILREWVDMDPVFAAASRLRASCPDLTLLIIGEEGIEETRRKAAHHGVTDLTIFCGTVPHDEVPRYIACMDVCLVPFKSGAVSEGAMPLKLFEYMACEKPVISTRVKVVERVVGARIAYATSTAEYVDQVSLLMTQADTRKRMGTEGRRFVEENYSWRSSCEKLEAILEDLARRPASKQQ